MKIIIITSKKTYLWRPAVLLRNLLPWLALLYFISAYLYLSHQDYLTLIR